jgi:HEAT repeat protein
MNVNRRTWTLLIVAVAVIGGVYAITLWQRARETRRLLDELQVPDHAVAAQATTSLRERVPSVREQLVDLAEQEGSPARWRAVKLLGLASGDASRDVLMGALEASDPIVRAAAAGALAERGVRGAADRVAMLATSTQEPMQVRLAAVRALRQFRTSTHVAEMAELATDRGDPPPPEESEEEEAAEEEPADDEATEGVATEDEAADEPTEEPAETEEAEAEETAATSEEEAEEWSDETEQLRIEAVRTIAVLGASGGEHEGAGTSPTARAAEVLAEACSTVEHSDEVRQAACYAWVDLAQMQMGEEILADAVEALIGAADDEIGDVRVAAVQGLSTLEPPTDLRDDVEQVMEDALNDDHYWVRVAAGEEPISG